MVKKLTKLSKEDLYHLFEEDFVTNLVQQKKLSVLDKWMIIYRLMMEIFNTSQNASLRIVDFDLGFGYELELFFTESKYSKKQLVDNLMGRIDEQVHTQNSQFMTFFDYIKTILGGILNV